MFTTGQGISYPLFSYWGAASPKAVFLLVHGLGGHPGRWESMADFFSARGFSSYALALRGFGDTPGVKGHVDSFETYISDIDRVISIIKQRHSGRKIFIAGESLGGLLSFLACGRDCRAGGLICMSPAFGQIMKIGFAKTFRVLLSLISDPSKQFALPIQLSLCTRDKRMLALFDNDPREHRLASARLLWEILRAQFISPRLALKVSLPVLFLLSGEDKIEDPEKSKAVFRKIGSGDKTIRVYPEMYHSLPIESGREAVFEDIFEWVSKRI